MKHEGNLIIEKGNKADYSKLTEVSGSVDVQEGATFTTPLLAETLYKKGYKILHTYHHEGRFPSGYYLPVLTEKEKELLGKLKPIISSERLYMGHWHQNDNWKEQETNKVLHECKTTHCMYGWFQIFEKDKLNNLSPEVAGKRVAPNLHPYINSPESLIENIVNTIIVD